MSQANTGTETGSGATTLQEAVKGAFKEHVGEDDMPLKVDEKTGETVVVEKKAPTKAAAPAQTDEVVDNTFEIDATPEEIGNALALFRSIADPKSRNSVLENLAQQAGYNLGNKQEVKQLSDDLATILKETLGDSYALLEGDKLAAALDRITDTKVKKLIDPVMERINRSEMLQHQQQANTALASLWARQEVPEAQRDKIAGAMMAKMKVLPPAGDATADEYLDDIYFLVSREADKARTVKTTVKRIQSNAQDASRNVSGGGGDESRIKQGSCLPSIKESVAAAFRNEKLED